MSIRQQLAGAVEESQRLLRRKDQLTVAGRSVDIILGSESRALPAQNVGLVTLEGAAFHVLKSDLTGHTIDSLLNQLASFKGRQYRVVRVADNDLRWGLECESKDSRR